VANILNFVAFQLVWFIAIFSAASNKSFLAIPAVLFFAVVQIFYSRCKLTDLTLVLIGFVIGMTIDSIWLNLHWIDYSDIYFSSVAPLWIGCLWINFMLTLNHSMSWLNHRLLWLSVLSLIAAPLSYYAGARAGAIILNEPLLALIAVALSWAIWIPVAMHIANRLRNKEESTS